MKDNLIGFAASMAEKGRIPDSLLRWGIRRLCRQRLRAEQSLHNGGKARQQLIQRMNAAAIAPRPEMPNQQHYEVAADFFRLVLGHRLKYSCCCWEANGSLDEAEDRALEVSGHRARLADGQHILELGCGWGSLTLWMAEEFPNSQITAVSNSGSQRDFIMSQARTRDLRNVNVITADMNDFSTDQSFDRVVSIEMFEHMRNYRLLLERISDWLKPEGLLFVHVFCHDRYAYEFEDRESSDWMARHFFTAGLMPSEDLLTQFQEDLALINQWSWSGDHYRRTAQAWLDNLDRRRPEVLRVLARTHPPEECAVWLQRWRMFFMACSELFGFEEGSQWGVAHYLFGKAGGKG